MSNGTDNTNPVPAQLHAAQQPTCAQLAKNLERLTRNLDANYLVRPDQGFPSETELSELLSAIIRLAKASGIKRIEPPYLCGAIKRLDRRYTKLGLTDTIGKLVKKVVAVPQGPVTRIKKHIETSPANEKILKVGSLRFIESDFKAPLTPAGLWKAVKEFGTTIPKAGTAIDGLNELLKGKSLHRSFKPKTYADEAKKLIAREANLSEEERIRLNRLLLEANFPKQCPQRQKTLLDQIKDRAWDQDNSNMRSSDVFDALEPFTSSHFRRAFPRGGKDELGMAAFLDVQKQHLLWTVKYHDTVIPVVARLFLLLNPDWDAELHKAFHGDAETVAEFKEGEKKLLARKRQQKRRRRRKESTAAK